MTQNFRDNNKQDFLSFESCHNLTWLDAVSHHLLYVNGQILSVTQTGYKHLGFIIRCCRDFRVTFTRFCIVQWTVPEYCMLVFYGRLIIKYTLNLLKGCKDAFYVFTLTNLICREIIFILIFIIY